MKDFQFITNSSPAYIENLYQDFVKNPDTVDPELKKFFEGFDFAITQGRNGANALLLRPMEQQLRKLQRKLCIKPPMALTGKKNWALTGLFLVTAIKAISWQQPIPDRKSVV